MKYEKVLYSLELSSLRKTARSDGNTKETGPKADIKLDIVMQKKNPMIEVAAFRFV